MPSTTTAEKAELRRRARQYLRELSPQVRRASDDALFARFLALPQVEAADTLLLYHGMGGEPDTARLLPALWARGKAVCLPRCLPGRGLEARLVRPDSALIPTPMGCWSRGRTAPGGQGRHRPCAGARSGLRPLRRPSGPGGGFYDRWLADYAGCTAALCRTALLLPQVPRAPMTGGWSWCSPSTACTGRMRRGAGPNGPAPRRTVRKRLSSSRRCTRSCCCSHSCSRSHCRPSFRRSSSKG
ncbi:MAG: 5-formyltetrahydrofolate cyclo-ligase [Flavonifractor plautii]